jgi:prolyl oligopeptidase
MLRSSLRTSTRTPILSIALIAGSLGAQTANPPLAYPPAPRGTQVDVYNGTSVADPYRWLEDVDAPATKEWVAAQNRLTDGFLTQIPERAAIRNRLTQLWNYARYSAPFKEGGRYFYFQNTGLQNQSVLYVQDGRNAPRVLLDPNLLSTDGTVALSGVEASNDGHMLAYSVSTSGSDWQELHVRNVDNGRDLPDVIKWVKFSGVSWTHDNKGFFYSRYDEPTSGNKMTNANKNHKVYYHRVGQPQSRDELVYDRSDQPDWLFDATVTDDGQYLVITVSQGTDVRTRIYFIDLDNPGKPHIDNPVVRLIDKLDAEYEFMGNRNTLFYVRTDKNAPRGRIVAINIDNAREERWNTIVPESKDALVTAVMAGDDIVANYLQDAHSSVRFFTAGRAQPEARPRPAQQPQQQERPKGNIYDDTSTAPVVSRERNVIGGGFSERGELALPGIGSVDVIHGKQGDEEMFYSFTSFLYPTTVYRYDFKSRRSEVFRAPKVAFDASPYETRQVFFNSKDGTRVPMFITMKKGLQLDGNNPTLLYAYGGFNISMTPAFSPANLAWLEMGGIYAVPNIRGGGEYGKAWHEGGMLANKQNVFDDFIAAAQYLIQQKYTSTPKLAIRGGSNGGLLIGAVLNQRPDLFGAALPEVGVMDMLRFQKFTIGWAWTSDYGSSDKAEQFKYLYAYSPLHNIKPGACYPPTLAFTADHDDRVVPGHTFKYVATLQAAQSCRNPILARIETKSGHGAGRPTTKLIDEAADRFSFLVRELHMKPTLQ